MKIILALAVAAAVMGLDAVCVAQNSNAPPDARKEGGVAGDPSGAIRALGGTSQTNFKQERNKVDVPMLGGSAEAGGVGGTPKGTTRPR